MIIKSRRTFIKSSIFLATGLLLTDSLWVEKFFIRVNKFSADETGKERKGFTFIQISDLHLNAIGYAHEYIANKINETGPNLLFITGDSIDKKENLQLLEKFLAKINVAIRKVAILGNWEHWGGIDLEQLDSLYRKYNCDLLINRSSQYQFKNKTVSVTGIDDYIGGQADYELAMKSFTKSDLHVVLTHCPQHRDQIKTSAQKEDIDFVLSGHTHGGQINLFGFAPFLPKGSGNYVSGWYTDTSPHLYVSKGVGTSILPVRFGARAEITIFYV